MYNYSLPSPPRFGAYINFDAKRHVIPPAPFPFLWESFSDTERHVPSSLFPSLRTCNSAVCSKLYNFLLPCSDSGILLFACIATRVLQTSSVRLTPPVNLHYPPLQISLCAQLFERPALALPEQADVVARQWTEETVNEATHLSPMLISTLPVLSPTLLDSC